MVNDKLEKTTLILTIVLVALFITLLLLFIFARNDKIRDENNFAACSVELDDCADIYDCEMKNANAGYMREKAHSNFQICIYNEEKNSTRNDENGV